MMIGQMVWNIRNERVFIAGRSVNPVRINLFSRAGYPQSCLHSLSVETGIMVIQDGQGGCGWWIQTVTLGMYGNGALFYSTGNCS